MLCPVFLLLVEAVVANVVISTTAANIEKLQVLPGMERCVTVCSLWLYRCPLRTCVARPFAA